MYLEIENLNIKLDEFKLENINFTVDKGEYLILIGPTGSGKSVLLESIIGFYTPDSGIIKLNNKILNDVTPEKRNIGIVYQDHVLFPNMNVYENIAYGLKTKTKDENEINEKIENITKILNINHLLERNISTLSGGESQRTALARALVVNPDIILMDEPFSALDVTSQAKITQLIKEIGRKFNTTFIHVTHNFNDIWNLADRVGVMKNGKLYQIDTIDKVFSKPNNEFVANFVGVHNLFEGEIINTNENSVSVKINDDIILQSTDEEYCKLVKNKINNIHVLVAIRPENIIFANETFESSARNRLKGKVTEITESGPIINVTCSVDDIEFKGILTRNSYEKLNIKIDKEIYLIFKSLNVKILDSYHTFKKKS